MTDLSSQPDANSPHTHPAMEMAMSDLASASPLLEKSEIAAPDDARECPHRAPANVARAQAHALCACEAQGGLACPPRTRCRPTAMVAPAPKLCSAPAPAPVPEAEPPVRVPAPKSPMRRTGKSKKKTGVAPAYTHALNAPTTDAGASMGADAGTGSVVHLLMYTQQMADLDRASATCPQFPNTNLKPASAKPVPMLAPAEKTRAPDICDGGYYLHALAVHAADERTRIRAASATEKPTCARATEIILRCARSIYVRNIIALQSASAPVASEPAENYTFEYPGAKLHETACVKSASANANVDPGPHRKPEPAAPEQAEKAARPKAKNTPRASARAGRPLQNPARPTSKAAPALEPAENSTYTHTPSTSPGSEEHGGVHEL
ncbi:hypothetical protein FB451DRAFT_1403612 [Mycena latifolia]|nr:hypothetical protein FB451DRAFT_1403612 [Mycena latifolia]